MSIRIKIKSLDLPTLFLQRRTDNTCSATGVEFYKEKNIVKAVVDGSDSEVIECFGCKSWDITISGILVDLDEHSYPSERVQKLRELFEINDILEVLECKIMNDLNIQSLYMIDLKI
ncbi:MAG: DUF6046 domain-containing protein [Bacteroidales bacterium]|nr:DUF6046 domain-containing protein [Bacteroidales bacterium]